MYVFFKSKTHFNDLSSFWYICANKREESGDWQTTSDASPSLGTEKQYT